MARTTAAHASSLCAAIRSFSATLLSACVGSSRNHTCAGTTTTVTDTHTHTLPNNNASTHFDQVRVGVDVVDPRLPLLLVQRVLERARVALVRRDAEDALRGQALGLREAAAQHRQHGGHAVACERGA